MFGHIQAMKNNVFACILAAAHFDSQAVQILGAFPSRAVGRVSGNSMLSWNPEKQTSLDTIRPLRRWVIRVPDASWGAKYVEYVAHLERVLAEQCLTVVNTCVNRQSSHLSVRHPSVAHTVFAKDSSCHRLHLVSNHRSGHVSLLEIVSSAMYPRLHVGNGETLMFFYHFPAPQLASYPR